MHKRLLRILLLALIAVMLTGFYDDYPIDENVLPITDLSIPNKLYWLEAFAVDSKTDRTICLMEYDLRSHELRRAATAEPDDYDDDRSLDMVQTNHSGGAVVVQTANDRDFKIYAFDESGSFRCQFAGSADQIDDVDAIYDGRMYYRSGRTARVRDLSTGVERQVLDNVGWAMCISPDGKYFNCERLDDTRFKIEIYSDQGYVSKEFEFPENSELGSCRCAVWKDADTVLLPISIRLKDGRRVTYLYGYSVREGALKPYTTRHGECIVLESTYTDLLQANGLQIDRSGEYISYVSYKNALFSIKAENSRDIYVQSLIDGKKYLVYSMLTEQNSYAVGNCTKVVWQ